jgi:hypothetical protein
MQRIEFDANYATDILGVKHDSITTKRKYEVKGRAHVSFVSVAVRVAF